VCDDVGALRLALPEGDVLAGNLVNRDQHVVRRHARCRGDARVDVLQQFKPRLLRSPLDESDIENDQIVGVIHPDERRRVEKAVIRQLEDELVEILGRHAKRVDQGCLYGARYLGHPGLVVTAFDNVDFCKRHDMAPFQLVEPANYAGVKNFAAVMIAQCVEAAGAGPQGGRAQAAVWVAPEHTVEEVACCAVFQQQVVGIVEVLARFGDDPVRVVVKVLVLVSSDDDSYLMAGLGPGRPPL